MVRAAPGPGLDPLAPRPHLIQSLSMPGTPGPTQLQEERHLPILAKIRTPESRKLSSSTSSLVPPLPLSPASPTKSPSNPDHTQQRCHPDLLALSHLYELRHLQTLGQAPLPEDSAQSGGVQPKPRKLEPLVRGRGPPAQATPWDQGRVAALHQ